VIHHSSVNNSLLVNFFFVTMADFAAMMREEIAARAAKSAAEKFRQEMDAFYGITPSPQIPMVGPFIDSPVDVVEVVTTTSPPVASTILPDIILPEASTQLNSEPVISIPVATTLSPDIPVTSSVVTPTEMPLITSVPVIIPTAHAQPMDPVSTTVVPLTSSAAPPSISRPRPSSTTTYRSTLREVMQKVDRDRQLMFEIPVIPVDPIDSKRFDTPLPKVIKKSKVGKTAALPDSPDVSSLQADLTRRRQQWRQKKVQADMQRKENDLSLSAYGVAQSITPSQIVVPVMPEYSTVVTPSMATETILPDTLYPVPGSTKNNDTAWMFDMRTGEGIAILSGLTGAGKQI
jgi:hypothetical protein